MAKFIIEVDDDFIRENANVEVAKKKVDGCDDKGGFARAMFDLIAYSSIAKRIDKGETEFRITRDMMNDDTKCEHWERQVPDVLMLASLAGPDEKKEG
jgi:hypothetical protein